MEKPTTNHTWRRRRRILDHNLSGFSMDGDERYWNLEEAELEDKNYFYFKAYFSNWKMLSFIWGSENRANSWKRADDFWPKGTWPTLLYSEGWSFFKAAWRIENCERLKIKQSFYLFIYLFIYFIILFFIKFWRIDAERCPLHASCRSR